MSYNSNTFDINEEIIINNYNFENNFENGCLNNTKGIITYIYNDLYCVDINGVNFLIPLENIEKIYKNEYNPKFYDLADDIEGILLSDYKKRY